ncbi:MAG: DUF4190 domain-containing protein [Verrucomicrobiota bacterium]
MATIKVACPKCGQKVSGDETFAGAVVPCPVCSADIQFPGETRGKAPTGILRTEAYEPGEATGPVEIPAQLPDFDESAPQATAGEVTGSDEYLSKETVDEPVAPESDEEEEEQVVPSPVSGAVSLVASILGVVLCVFGGILFSPIAIIFGHVSQAKARRSPVQPAPGQTLGAIGMLVGYVWLAITILILGILILFEDSIRQMIQEQAS